MGRGRPKGEHTTMISARLYDTTINKLNDIKNSYGIGQSKFINMAIIYFYHEFKKENIQNLLGFKFKKEEEAK